MLPPRENLNLYGHQEAKRTFLQAYHSARFPHAWILAGPYGIGKATFAFHVARYILSGRQDSETSFTGHEPFHRRIAAQSHGDLWTLGDEEGKEIGVEAVRDLNSVLNQTPAEGGWRVVIIDGAEKLNRNAANALLKRLEEPPPKTIFFLATSMPGRLLPTIRSRCQLLSLLPLSEEDVQDVLKSQGLPAPDFLSLAHGSPGRLIRLMEGEGPSLYTSLKDVLKGKPAAPFVHKYGTEETTYELVEDLLRTFIHTHLLEKVKGNASFFKDISMDQTLNLYEKISNLFDNCRLANLDRKATLNCVFANLERRTFA